MPKFAPMLVCLFLMEIKAGELTLDWILEPENTRALQAPRTLWLSGEKLLIDDAGKPAGERGVEIVDLKTLVPTATRSTCLPTTTREPSAR